MNFWVSFAIGIVIAFSLRFRSDGLWLSVPRFVVYAIPATALRRLMRAGRVRRVRK